MFVTFTQGGTPVNVTLNSVVATGAVTSMGDPTYATNGYFRWNVRTLMDPVGLHLVFNVTINGVGMVLEMDYPIVAPVTPELEWLYGPAWAGWIDWVKNVPMTFNRFRVRVPTETRGVENANGAPFNLATMRSDSDNLVFSGPYVEKNGSAITSWLGASFTPLEAGQQDLYIIVSIDGMEYRCKTTATVSESIGIVYEATTPLTTRKDNEVFFTLVPPAGVTIDPAEIPRLTTPPHPISGSITIVDGKYRMLVNPVTETLGNFTKGSVSAGTIAGAPALPARMRPSFSVSSVGNQLETAGAAIQSFVYALTDAGLVLGWDLAVALKNLRVTSSVPGALKTTPAASMVASGNTVYGKASTNLVDYAMITWTVDVLGRETGYTYPDVSWTSVIHDSAVATHIPPADPYLKGMTYDVHYKLTWLTSGNPVTMGMTAPADMKTIDAANGIYAVPNVAMSGDTVTVTPKWSFENSRNTYTGTAFTINPVDALTSTLPILTAYASGSVTQNRPQYFGFKSLPSAGLSGSTITTISNTPYSVNVNGASITELEPNLWFVPVTAGTNTVAPAKGWTTFYACQPNIAFMKDDTKTLMLTAKVISNVVPVTAMTEITTLGGEVHLTVQAGVTSGFTGMGSMPCDGWTLYGIDGEVIEGQGGAVSTYATDNRVHLNLPEIPAIRHGVLVVRMMNVNNNIKIHVGASDVNVVKLNKAPIVSGGVMTVSTATTVKFSLTPPEGVTYSNPTVTVASNPWTTAGTLTDNGDGTYSISVTPDVETGGRIIKLNVVQDGKTYVHGVKTVAKDAAPLVLNMFSSTGDTIGSLNGGVFQITKGGVEQMWELSGSEATLPLASVKVSSAQTGFVIGAIQNQMQALLQRRGFLVTTSAPAGAPDYAELLFEADVTSPVTGLTQKVSYTQGISKQVAWSFDTSVIPYVGEPTVIPFTLKYSTSQAPVTNPSIVSASITGSATVDPTLIVIDAAAGKYGVKVTSTAVNNHTLSLVVRIGKLLGVMSFSRAFTTVLGATPTLGVMA